MKETKKLINKERQKKYIKMMLILTEIEEKEIIRKLVYEDKVLNVWVKGRDKIYKSIII